MIEQSLLFKGASPESVKSFLELSKTRSVKEGEFLFLEGEEPNHVYYVLSGAVSFSFHDKGGKSFVIGIAPADTIIGELEVFNERPRISQALALQDSEILVIRRKDFVDIFKNDAAVLYQMLRHYAKELEYLMRFSLLMDVEKRLALALVELTQRFGEQSDNGITIKLPLSQETIAAMVGKPRQRVNRLLKQWEESQWISIKYRELTVTNLKELKNFAVDIN